MDSLGELIEACREEFGAAPRKMSAEEQQEFRLRPSLLMRVVFLLSMDRLRRVVRDQDVLRDRGEVVWGCLVQANSVLFNPDNRAVLPANVIYSTDPYYDDEVSELEELAHGLFDLKGTGPGDRELDQFADAITNELARTMKLRLPRSITEGRKVYFTTCLIQPSHLPDGYLARGFFPLVICPDETEAVMILPSHYWPKGLRRLWQEE